VCFDPALSSFDGAVDPHPVKPTYPPVIAAPENPNVHELTLTTGNPKGITVQRRILRAGLLGCASLPDARVTATASTGMAPTASAQIAAALSAPSPQAGPTLSSVPGSA
jgi:hypothetical protein